MQWQSDKAQAGLIPCIDAGDVSFSEISLTEMPLLGKLTYKE